MEKNKLATDCKALIIGGSAGSLTVLFKLLPLLQPGFKYALILVLHRKNSGDSSLSDLLAFKSLVPVREIEDKDVIVPGIIYLAPADYHILIEKDYSFSLDYSEKINYSRPSLDVTFESAADIYGPFLTAIILSGANEDGTRGMAEIKKAGGTLIAQDPETAQMSVMPLSAIQRNNIEQILSPDEIGAFLQ